MVYLLDTNILSELRKPRPESRVLSFVSEVPIDDQFVSSVTLAEIRFGIDSIPDEVRRRDLQQWLNGAIRPLFARRVLEFTENVLVRWRKLMEDGRKTGRTYSQPDLLIAATAREHNLTLVTRNTKDFIGVSDLTVHNPWNQS